MKVKQVQVVLNLLGHDPSYLAPSHTRDCTFGKKCVQRACAEQTMAQPNLLSCSSPTPSVVDQSQLGVARQCRMICVRADVGAEEE